jgi:hypothetical protein
MVSQLFATSGTLPHPEQIVNHFCFRGNAPIPKPRTVFPEIFATTLAAMLAYNHKGNRSNGDGDCNTKKSDSP